MYSCQKSAKRRAYIALERPHLEYCSPVWSPQHCKYIDILEKVQKRAAQWVGGVHWDKNRCQRSQHYSDCCLDLQWLTLKNRRFFLDCCQTYKIMHGLDCIQFKKITSEAKLTICNSILTHFSSLNLMSMLSDIHTLSTPLIYGINYLTTSQCHPLWIALNIVQVHVCVASVI